jgi:hypothetical protein
VLKRLTSLRYATNKICAARAVADAYPELEKALLHDDSVRLRVDIPHSAYLIMGPPVKAMMTDHLSRCLRGVWVRNTRMSVVMLYENGIGSTSLPHVIYSNAIPRLSLRPLPDQRFTLATGKTSHLQTNQTQWWEIKIDLQNERSRIFRGLCSSKEPVYPSRCIKDSRLKQL